jgi:hypothetical protein
MDLQRVVPNRAVIAKSIREKNVTHNSAKPTHDAAV